MIRRPFLLTCSVLGLVACNVGSKPVAGPAQPAVAAPAASTSASVPAPAASAVSVPQPPPPPVLFLDDKGMVVRVQPDGSGATPLKLATDTMTGGAMGIGSGGPVLSSDRRWIAYQSERDLWVASTDGSGPRQITTYNQPGKKGSKTGAEVLIGGFTPDGARLLFHVDEIHCLDDCPALPKGVTPGFELLELSTMQRTRLPTVEGFDAFTGDGKAALYNKILSGSSYELRAYSLIDGSSRVVRTSKDPYGFSQLVVEGDRLAIVEAGAVVMGPVEGTTWTPLTPKAPFAELQSPELAPGGAHLSYARHGKNVVSIEVVPTKAPATATVVCEKCTARWHDATHLVVSDPNGLRLVGLDGSSVKLAPKGTPIPLGTD